MPIGDDFGLVALTTAIYKATDVLQQSVDAVADSQKASAALGRTFDLGKSELGASIKKLDGTISQRLSIAFEALNQGVNLNSTQVLKLAEFQKITNQDSKKTLQLFATLEKQLNFSTDASELLAVTLVESSKEYGISTEYLVASLADFINANKEILNITKLAEPVTQAMAQVQAQLGPGLSKELNKFLGVLYSAGSENLSVINNLGLASIRQQIAFAQTAEEQQRLQLEAITIAGQRITSFSDQYGSSLTAAGDAMKAQFGDLAGVAKSLFDELADSGDRVVRTDKLLFDINQKILKVLDPLKELFFELVETNQQLIYGFIDLAERGIKKLITTITDSNSLLSKSFQKPVDALGAFVGLVFGATAALKLVSGLGSSLSIAVVQSKFFTTAIQRLGFGIGTLVGRFTGASGIMGIFSRLLGGAFLVSLKAVGGALLAIGAVFAKVLVVAGILYGVFLGIKNAVNSATGGFEGLRQKMQPAIDAVMAIAELLFTLGQVVGMLVVKIVTTLMPIFSFFYNIVSSIFNAIADLLGGFLGGNRVKLSDTFGKMATSLKGIEHNTETTASIALADSAARKSELAAMGAEGTGTAAIVAASRVPKAVSDLISGFKEGSIAYKKLNLINPTGVATDDLKTEFLTREEFLEAVGSLSGKKELDLLLQIFDANTQAAYKIFEKSKDAAGFLDRIRLEKAIATTHGEII